MEPILARVESVLFDMDGTLVDTHIDFTLMKRRMVDLAVDSGMHRNSLAGMDILAIIDAAVNQLASQSMTEESIALRARAMSILEEIELHHAADTQEIPLARELINELKDRGTGVGIVTRNCRKASIMSLSITRIVPDVLICREDCERHKPNPDPLFMALHALNASPGNSIMVGDHIMDIQSGKAAGMKTIGLLREDRSDNFFDQIAPDFVARNLKEVWDAIIHSDR